MTYFFYGVRTPLRTVSLLPLPSPYIIYKVVKEERLFRLRIVLTKNLTFARLTIEEDLCHA